MVLGFQSNAPVSKAKKNPVYYDRVFVVTVGINQYKNSELPASNDRYIKPLAYAEADAQEMAGLLDSKYGFTIHRTLLGSAATKPAILQSIDELRIKTNSNGKTDSRDAVILYFSGHGVSVENPNPSSGDFTGVNSGFFLPWDCAGNFRGTSDWAEYESSAFNMKELVISLRGEFEHLQHLIIIIDSCFSGFATSSKGERKLKPKLIAQYPTKQVISAGTDTELAQESDEYRHGNMTYFIIDELSNNQTQTLGQIFENVKKRVVQNTIPQQLPQRRYLKNSYGDFVFIPLDDKNGPATVDEWGGKQAGKGVLPVEDIADEELHEVQIIAQDRESKHVRQPDLSEYWVNKYTRYEDMGSSGGRNALTAMSICKRVGLGTEIDERGAFIYANEADDAGAEVAKVVLGTIYAKGLGEVVKKNPGMARFFATSTDSNILSSDQQKDLDLLNNLLSSNGNTAPSRGGSSGISVPSFVTDALSGITGQRGFTPPATPEKSMVELMSTHEKLKKIADKKKLKKKDNSEFTSRFGRWHDYLYFIWNMANSTSNPSRVSELCREMDDIYKEAEEMAEIGGIKPAMDILRGCESQMNELNTLLTTP